MSDAPRRAVRGRGTRRFGASSRTPSPQAGASDPPRRSPPCAKKQSRSPSAARERRRRSKTPRTSRLSRREGGRVRSPYRSQSRSRSRTAGRKSYNEKPEPAVRRISDGESAAGHAAREELARRWADIKTAKAGNPAGIIQRTVQMRANIMQRRAQHNLLRRASEGQAAAFGFLGAAPQEKLPEVRCQPAQDGTVGVSIASANPSPLAPPSGIAKPAPPMASPGCLTALALATGVDASFVVQGTGNSSSSSAPARLPTGATPAAPVPPGRGFVLALWAQAAQSMNAATNSDVMRAFRAALHPVNGQLPRGGSQGFLRHWDDDTDAVVVVDSSQHPRSEENVHDRTGVTRDSSEQHKRRAAAVLGALAEERLKEAAVEKCAVCLEAMAKGDIVRALPCAHIFHSSCISRWLQISLSCPLDKMPVDDSIDMMTAAGAEAFLAGSGTSDEPQHLPPPPPHGPTVRPEPVSPRPVGLAELRTAAADAGVPVGLLADVLAQRRSLQLELNEQQQQAGNSLLVLE